MQYFASRFFGFDPSKKILNHSEKEISLIIFIQYLYHDTLTSWYSVLAYW